jgi:hypothetical protein
MLVIPATRRQKYDCSLRPTQEKLLIKHMTPSSIPLYCKEKTEDTLGKVLTASVLTKRKTDHFEENSYNSMNGQYFRENIVASQY